MSGLLVPAAAAAYRQGEALRLLGRTDKAEDAYRRAQRGGYDPAAGLARLQLDQRRVSAASATVRRALAVEDDPVRRAELLPVAVEAMLAADEPVDAATAASELGEIAVRWPTAGLRAVALQVRGAVALAAGDPATAATSVRDAWQLWTAQQATYEAALARLLLARACAALGDDEAAAAEESAGQAALALLRTSEAEQPQTAASPSGVRPMGLSAREVQVLRLISTGLTNRAIAERLVLSERTVDRHVSNILGKLGAATRTAATAFAFEHGLT
jgi:DNA-binding NarL/FixJ family response regulator